MTPPPEPARSSPKAHDALHQDRAALRQRGALLWIIRILFIGFLVGIPLLSVLQVDTRAAAADQARVIDWPRMLGMALGLAAVVILVDLLTPRKKIATLFGIFFGLLGAILVALTFGLILDLLAKTYDFKDESLLALLKVMIGIAMAYLGITTVLQTGDDFRLVIPYIEFAKQIRGAKPLALDSSTLIDGRIVELARTGILQAPLVIPRFVIAELQLLADSGDKAKRTRGRRGLSVVAQLQRSGVLDVTIDETEVPGKAVDQMLVELARTMPAVIVTGDTGLSRVAQIQGVPAVNLADLAAALRPAVLPGEAITIALVRQGEQPEQAVGYLEDGTMVVAENGREAIGRSVTLTITSTLQTSAGRMVFARLGGETPAEAAGENATPGTPTPQTPPPPPPENAGPGGGRAAWRPSPTGRNPRRA